MMKSFVYFLFIAWSYNINSVLPVSLNEYLVEKSKVLQEVFTHKERLLHKRDSSNVFVENVGENIRPEISDYIKIFTVFNKTYILSKSDIYEVYNDSTDFNLIPQNNSLEEISDGERTFTKEIMFKNISFLITKSELMGEAYVYTSSEKYNLIQTLFVPDSTDAHFFINNQNLYLMVANNKGDNLAVTSIYKWLGFHFDEIQTVFTTGAIKVRSFTTRATEIIIILQDISNRTVPSFVYEFNNEEIRKIQHLKTTLPVHLDIYSSKKKHYLVIYDRSKNNTIYRWNDLELTVVNEFRTENVVFKSEVLKANGTSLLVIPFNIMRGKTLTSQAQELVLNLYEYFELEKRNGGHLEPLFSVQEDKIQIYSLLVGTIKMEIQQRYSSNISEVLDIQKINEKIYVVGLDEHHAIQINIFSISIRDREKDTAAPEKEVLWDCFKNLESKVDRRESVFKQTASVLHEDLDQNNEVILTESLMKEPEIEIKIKQLKDKLNNINLVADNYTVPDANNLIVNGDLTIKGRIVAEKLKGNAIVIKNINEQRWTPEQWLKYEEPQTITGMVKITTLTTDYLETGADNPLFKDMLLKNGNQVFTESLEVQNFTANSMYAKIINDVTMDDVYLKNRPLQIKGVKTFKTLNVLEARTKSLNEETPDFILSTIVNLTDPSPSNFDFDHVIVDHLEVENVNGVPWNQFKDSVIRINNSQEIYEITGPLNLASLQTDRMHIKKIKDIDIDTLFTTSTDQNVDANVEMKSIVAHNVTAGTVNNINFVPENLVYLNQTEPITGPVNFSKVRVEHDLNVNGTLHKSSSLKMGDHIFGTNESDLMQIYSGKITINGNVFLKNLNLLPNTKLFVSETNVNPNLTEYWRKNTPQEIPVRVNFTKNLSVHHLLTEDLNNVNFTNLFLNSNEKEMETDFVFGNVTVLGNVILRENAEHTPDLNKIWEESVKRTGSQVIHGKKTYVDTLKVENLQTQKLEGIKVSQAVNSRLAENITGVKTIKNLVIENDAMSNFKDVKTINGISVDSLRDGFMFIDQPQNITVLDFKFLNVTNLHINDINGRNLDDYLSLSQALNETTGIKDLTITGNVSIDHVKNMSSLNDIPYESLTKNALHIGKSGLLDNIKFTNNIKVDNLIAKYVNDINMERLTNGLLTKHTNQNITALFNFTNIKTDNLVTPKINNVSVENLINIRSTLRQKIFAPNGTVFSNVVLKSLKASGFTPCNLETIKRELADPPTQEWAEVEIKGNVTLLDENSLLYRVLEKAVKLNADNIIHSPVNFSASVLMRNLNTPKPINGVNIPEILEDAVLSESEESQKIGGIKWFTTLRTKNALVLDNVDTTRINEEDVIPLNETIVDKNDSNRVIKGMKTFFSGLQTDKLNSKRISNIDPDNIVSLTRPKPVPEAIFDRFVVKNNLNIKFYGGVNFTDVLHNRLVVDGETVQSATGIYYFENLEVHDLVTPVINDINTEDMVFDIGTQNISGIKHFLQPLTIIGNVHVDIINAINLTDRFENAISSRGPVNISGNVTILKPASGNGTINAESINGQSVSLIKKILSAADKQIETEEIFNIKTQLVEKVNNTIPMVKTLPGEFMYLEKSNALQITVPDSVRASAIKSNEYVLIHVNGYEAGVHCGLPNNCSCPLQYAIEISPQFSVSIFPNRGFQRIFSYDDGKSTINFMTNSVSTSSTCRTSRTKLFNEVSMVTWNTKTSDNNKGAFYQYDKFLAGYISKVDFFTLNDKTYAVIGRYYDPVLDSYDLDCTVIKFSENKTHARQIQKIPTKGVQEVYLLQTSQGVVLVLGNKIPSDVYHEQENTMIYRFNPDTEEFMILRTVPSFGCSVATGIVLGTDSLLALAHNEAPVQVLKYYPEFDNYYFYQSFQLEDIVTGLSSFYAGGFGISEAYLCIVTSSERYYLYSYRFLEGFKLKSSGELEGLRNLIPLELNSQTYLFASSTKNSSLLTVVKSGFS